MLNSVNEDLLRAQLNRNDQVLGVTTNPIANSYKNIDKNLLIDETAISDVAINMYQKDLDIRNFTKLALSNPENTTHEDIVGKLFEKGVVDPFSDEAVSELANNKKFLNDLGL